MNANLSRAAAWWINGPRLAQDFVLAPQIPDLTLAATQQW